MSSGKKWREFREEVVELDGSACVRCKRSRADGAVLQVHHKRYIAGRAPWEYAYSDCETLCRGCHAAEHGKIPPNFGWTYFGEEDLGGLCGACEYCKTAIRHVFYIEHPKWPPLGVGTECCDNLTGTEIASNHMESLHRFASRRSRFLSSRRWKSEGGRFCIRQKKIRVELVSENAGYSIQMNNVKGKRLLASLDEAKAAAFEVIEDGRAEAALKKRCAL